MSDKNIIAVLIAVAMGLWLLSGEFGSSSASAEEAGARAGKQPEVPLVRGVESTASERVLYLEVRGQTKANRIVQVRAEVSGRVEAVTVKGTRVKAGDPLCKIALDTRQSDLDEARANVKSAELEYKGLTDLKKQGLQSEISIAKAKAALEASRAQEKRAELALAKTLIAAPFDGVVETQPVEIGDFLSVGQLCVTLMEVRPMLVVGQVAEKNIGQMKLGDVVEVTLITGETLEGKVSFIARAPDATTRTYPVEVTVDEPGDNVRAGLTAQMRVPVGREDAHLISPASLVLNDEGAVGVRIVDESNVVHFVPVRVVSEGPKGVWVNGLPERIRLITIGQEEVFDGQKVKLDLTPLGSVVSS